MILRLLRAEIREEAVAGVIAALRTTFPGVRAWPGMLAWTHGVRWDGDRVRGLTLSVWRDFDDIVAVGAGRPDEDLSSIARSGLLDAVAVDHYELVEPSDEGIVQLEGAMLAVHWVTVRPNAEAHVHERIRGVRDAMREAGVLALHVGRRLVDGRTEVVLLALWPDRPRMIDFARARQAEPGAEALSASFEEWRFEAYEVLSPGRLTIAPRGPAMLVIDAEEVIVRGSPGLEAVVGLPPELLLGRPFATLFGGATSAELAAFGEDLRRAGRAHALLSVELPGTTARAVQLEGVGDVPEPGLVTVTLSLLAPEAAAPAA